MSDTFELEFTRHGTAYSESQIDRLLDGLDGVDDLFVLSHGWNNDMAEANQLYATFRASVDALRNGGHAPGLANRRIAFAHLFWPSKRFADRDLIPGGGAASAHAEGDAALDQLLRELAHDPEVLGASEVDPTAKALSDRAIELVPDLEDSSGARREFVAALRAMLDPTAADFDDGSHEFLTEDPEELFRSLSSPVLVAAPPGRGGAAGMHDGGAAGLSDLISGIRAAARRIANFTTYYRMKDRAGRVGKIGVASLLRGLRRTRPDLHLHLVGHSFGGRLVTAAACNLERETPAVSVTLLQAAFSHNGLAERYDGERDGAFRRVLTERRASGPIVITHTRNDRAVGIAYPLASRIAGQRAAAFGDADDPYGGMGRNGALFTPEANFEDMLPVGGGYAFRPGKVFNLFADDFIPDHGTVAGLEPAQAALAAAAAAAAADR